MPNDNNDISNDELVMDEDIKTQKNGVDNNNNYTTENIILNIKDDLKRNDIN